MTDETTQTPDTAPADAGAPQLQLQLKDIVVAAQAIQLAAQRGAFRAEEFTEIGGMYDRIFAFLKDSGALNAIQPAAAPAEDTPAEDTPAAESTDTVAQ
jgi:hypothetical protein